MKVFEMLCGSLQFNNLTDLYNLKDLHKKKRKRSKDRYKGIRSKELRTKIPTRDNYICHYCGGRGETVDHVIPQSKGGTDDECNLVCSCEECNIQKGDEVPYGLEYVLNLKIQ
jgi:5-methylcytosine-specific restriction endonuclease McrA